jgi:hypothetical protein
MGRREICSTVEHFSGFEFFQLPSIIHARPRRQQRKPLEHQEYVRQQS